MNSSFLASTCLTRPGACDGWFRKGRRHPVSALAAALLASAAGAATTWTYDPAASTISANGWVLNCTYTAGATEITLKSPVADAPGGVLDLREMSVTDGTTTTKMARVKLSGAPFKTAAIREFYMDTYYQNSVVGTLPDSCFEGNAALEKVEISGPRFCSVGTKTFKDCAHLSSVRLTFSPTPSAPLVNIRAFENCTSLGCDIMDVIPANTRSIQASAFKNAAVRGRLVLSNVQDIRDGPFAGTGITDLLVNSPQPEAAILGYGAFGIATLTNAVVACSNVTSCSGALFYNATSLKTLRFSCPQLRSISNDTAFRNCKALVTLEFDCDSLDRIKSANNNVFYGSTAIRNLVFNTPALTNIAPIHAAVTNVSLRCGPFVAGGADYTAAVLDNILYAVPAVAADASAPKTCVLYADREAWAGHASPFQGKEATYRPRGAYGVYATADGARKAYFASPPDAKPAHMVIIVR